MSIMKIYRWKQIIKHIFIILYFFLQILKYPFLKCLGLGIQNEKHSCLAKMIERKKIISSSKDNLKQNLPLEN